MSSKNLYISTTVQDGSRVSTRCDAEAERSPRPNSHRVVGGRRARHNRLTTACRSWSPAAYRCVWDHSTNGHMAVLSSCCYGSSTRSQKSWSVVRSAVVRPALERRRAGAGVGGPDNADRFAGVERVAVRSDGNRAPCGNFGR